MEQGDFSVTVLGCGGALYAHGRHPSGQFLQIQQHKFLIDCGEGTQFRLKDLQLSPFSVREIFITHLHGDHYFGLAGLLSSMLLQGRTKSLTVFSPAGLEPIIRRQLEIGQKALSFPLRFVEVPVEGGAHCVFENEEVEVLAIPLKHRIPVAGYFFREKPRLRKMIKEKIEAYDLNVEQIKAVKRGEDILVGGKRISCEELSLEAPPARSFAYCSDTGYLPHLAKAIEGVSLLYHESTFAEIHAHKAERTFHSTASQAAMVARDAGAGSLLLGHFSGMYADLEMLREEAQSIFPHVMIAEEGKTYPVVARL